jgi:competence protein ComEC
MGYNTVCNQYLEYISWKGRTMKKLSGLLAILLLVMMLAAAGCGIISSKQPSPTPVSGLQVTFLDVGQADSILVQAGGANMLVDAGTNSTANSLVSTLKDKGISKFDVLVGTHPHEDHIGGMDAVINQFGIGKVYMPQVSENTKTFADVLQAIKNKGLTITTPVPGTSFNLGTVVCSILAPNSPIYTDMNDYSIVMRLFYGNTSLILTGDAGADSEKEMLAKGFTLKSDVLKVGHHGSTSATTPGFLKAVSPKYAVIEVGQGNDYGHPHKETLDKLNAAGIKIYRTDLNGSISFVSDGSKFTIKTGK